MKLEASIVVLCHNDAHYLENCAKSIFRNTKGLRYELILVDNNSKDNAAQIMKRIKKSAPCPVKLPPRSLTSTFAPRSARSVA